MNHQKQPHTWALRSEHAKIAQLEHMVRSTGVHLRATQLDGDSVRVNARLQKVGDIYLSRVCSNQVLSVEWDARPGSVNLSICVNEARLLLEGRARHAASMVVYSGPESAAWTAQWLPGAAGDAIYHITLPGDAAIALGLPAYALLCGWLDVPLPLSLASRVCHWLDQTLAHDPVDAMDAHYGASALIEALFAELSSAPREVSPPSHYSRIIRAFGDRCEVVKGPLSVARLADEIHVSTRTVQRAFHSTFRVGAKRYLRVRQLRRAHELLRAGDCSVSHAAHSVGFPHTSRFSQEYLGYFGVYPSDTIAAAQQGALDAVTADK